MAKELDLAAGGVGESKDLLKKWPFTTAVLVDDLDEQLRSR